MFLRLYSIFSNLLNYDHVKNHYRLLVVDLSRQKQLGFDPKLIQQIQFVGQLKKLDDNNGNATDAGNQQSILF